MKVAIVGGTGAFGRALAKRLHETGKDEILVGSRDAERAQATAAELGIAGGRNQDIVAEADLIVLAAYHHHGAHWLRHSISELMARKSG